MKTRIIITVFVCFSNFLFGQYRDASSVHTVQNIPLSGSVDIDLHSIVSANAVVSADTNSASGIKSYAGVNPKRYSPLTAGLLSAVVPGAGQLYTKSYWQSLGFFGAEVALWAVYAIYEAKGDNQNSYFQNYANQHWSVVRYAYWIQTYYPGQYNTNVVNGNPAPDVQSPWLYVNWSNLNLVEKAVGDLIINPGTITGFTHSLPSYGTQQYYELIGKYPQFGGGWDDAGAYTNLDVLNKYAVSPRFLEYSDMRGQANTFYAIASTASYVLVANHILGALEAAWNASRINHKLEMHTDLQPTVRGVNFIEFVPTFSLTMNLD